MARSRIPEMNWASENHEEALQLFKQTMSYYCEDEDITDPGKIALKILRGIENEGLKRLNASGMSDADKKSPDKIWELFESQLKTNLNFRVHRLHLMDYRQRRRRSRVSSGKSANTQTGALVSHTLKKDGSLPHRHRPPETQSSTEAMSTQSSHT